MRDYADTLSAGTRVVSRRVRGRPAVIAAPRDVEVEDRAAIKRIISATWKPGDGPLLHVIDYGACRGTRTYDGALVTAVLTYEWSPTIGGGPATSTSSSSPRTA